MYKQNKKEFLINENTNQSRNSTVFTNISKTMKFWNFLDLIPGKSGRPEHVRGTLTVFSSKFDVPVLIPLIVRYCEEHGLETSVLQKQSKVSYLSVKNENDDLIQFRDVLSYTSPCSLDGFLRQWKTTQTKGCFPHG